MMTGTVTDQDRESSEPRYLRPKTRDCNPSIIGSHDIIGRDDTVGTTPVLREYICQYL